MLMWDKMFLLGSLNSVVVWHELAMLWEVAKYLFYVQYSKWEILKGGGAI